MARTSWITTAVLVFLFVGVAFKMIAPGPTQVTPSPTAVIGSPAPSAEDAGLPLNRADAEQFGKEIESAFNTGDLARLSALIRVEELYARSMSDLGLTPAEQQAVTTGFQNSGGGQKTLTPYVQILLPNGCHVLRVRETAGRWTVLVRLLGEGDWFNYLEFRLYRHPSGTVAVDDVFVANLGEWMGTILRNEIITGYRTRAVAGTKVALAELEQVGRYQDAHKRGDCEAAYQEYRKLSDNWKQLRSFRANTLWALLGLPKKRVDLAAELKAYRETVPDGQDTVSAMIALEFHHSKADEPIIRKAILYLEEWTGGDPYLWVVEGRYRTKLGDESEAIRLFERTVKTEPTIEEAHLHLIGIAAAAEDHKLTLRRFQGLIEHCYPNEGFEDLTTIKHCDRFVCSPEYKQYLAWLAKKRGK